MMRPNLAPRTISYSDVAVGDFSFVMNSLLMNKSGQFDGPLEGPEVTRGIAMSGRWPTTWTDEDQPPPVKKPGNCRSFLLSDNRYEIAEGTQ